MTFLHSRALAARLVAGSLILLSISGCASYRVNTSLPAKKLAAPMPEDMLFRVVAVKFMTPTNVSTCGLPSFGAHPPDAEELRNRLMHVAMKAYPKSFSENPGAVPLEVTITRAANELDVGGEVCVSCLTLTILPLRITDKTDYSVQVQPFERPVIEALAAPVSFSREDTSWASILPTGWIPVPGGKGLWAWGMNSAIQKAGDLTLGSCAEAMAMAIRRVDAETWRTLRPGKETDEKK